MKTTSLQQKYRDTMSGVTGNEFIHFQNKHFISEVKSKECGLHHSFIEIIAEVVCLIKISWGLVVNRPDANLTKNLKSRCYYV